jgi:hypothetical protein
MEYVADKEKKLISPVQGAGTLKIKALAGLLSGEDLSLKMVAFHCVFTWKKRLGRSLGSLLWWH